MEKLIQRLKLIPGSYYEFIDSIAEYAQIKDSHLTLLMEYLETNPLAIPSDIIKLVSHQPDFFDDSVPEDTEILAG